VKEWSFTKNLAVLVFSLASIPGLIAANTFALQAIWGWHVTPHFGIDAPSVGRMFGLLGFVQLLVVREDAKEKKEGEKPDVPKLLGVIAGRFITIGLVTLVSWWLR